LGAPGDVTVPQAAAVSEPVTFQEHAVAAETIVTIAFQDPLSKEKKAVEIFLEPPRPALLQFMGQSTLTLGSVPVDGRQVLADLLLDGVSPSNGIKFNVVYSWTDSAGEKLSDTDIKGPRSIVVPGGARYVSFDLTIPPCGIHPPCRAAISVQGANGSASGTIIVNP
jgi:hypothetical protein